MQRAGVKPGWSSAYLEEVAQDLAYLRWIGDDREGVESALQDERVEVRVEAQRVAEGLIGDDGGGGDGLAGRGGVELGDQRGDE